MNEVMTSSCSTSCSVSTKLATFPAGSVPRRLNLVPAILVDRLDKTVHLKSFPLRLHWWMKQAPSTNGTHLKKKALLCLFNLER